MVEGEDAYREASTPVRRENGMEEGVCGKQVGGSVMYMGLEEGNRADFELNFEDRNLGRTTINLNKPCAEAAMADSEGKSEGFVKVRGGFREGQNMVS